MKTWDIYSYQIPGVREPHPAVVLGHVDRVANKPQVNILLCTSQRAGRPALVHEVLLNGADGLDWETLCKCDIVHVVEKAQLNQRRGQVCVERRRQIASKVIQGLGLAGLWTSLRGRNARQAWAPTSDGQNRSVKPRPPSNPQNLDELMVMAVDFAGFNLRSGRQTPPTLLAVTKKGPLFFTPASLKDDRSKDDFADTARLICIAYQVPAAVMILESWMKMAAEGEKLDPDERPAEAMDRHEVVMVIGETAGTTQRKVFKIIRTDAGGFFGLTEWEGLPMEQFQGRFVGLLSPKPLTAEVIEVARVMLAMKGLNEQKLRRLPSRR